MTIGERISSWRRALGFTQAQVADGVGKSKSTVSQWESDTQSPPLDQLEALVEFFGVTMARFYGRVPRPRKKAAA